MDEMNKYLVNLQHTLLQIVGYPKGEIFNQQQCSMTGTIDIIIMGIQPAPPPPRGAWKIMTPSTERRQQTGNAIHRQRNRRTNISINKGLYVR